MQQSILDKEREKAKIVYNLITDFTYYAPRALKVVDKEGLIRPFVLNKAQHYIHERLEEQLREKGKVRAIIVKGRQQGVSTYTEGRFIWKSTTQRGVRAFIMTHVAAATTNLFTMSKRFFTHLPDICKPEVLKNNSTEMEFHKLDSGFKVSTAGSIGVGRGSTFSHVHGSEVAYWSGEGEHLVGLMQAVPDANGTEIILESTAAGPQGVFYKLAMDALTGRNEYEVVFVPWFWQEEYRIEVDEDFFMTAEEIDYMTKWDLDVEQIAWRRMKINSFIRGIADFRREYPATIDEAFMAESKNALWTREMIRSISATEFNQIQEEYDEIATVIAFDPAGRTAGVNNDESGIVVARLLSDDTVYVLEDASGKYAPNEAAPTAISLYHSYSADRITIETNGVGAWAPDTIEMIDRSVVTFGVHARKGKRLRAEPIAHAYKQKRVVHVRGKNKSLENLENEMCTWNPYGNDKSPNRLDALVYAVTDLLDIDESAKKAPIMSSFLG